MTATKRQLGFSIIEIAIVVVVVGLVGFVGYTAYNKLHNNAVTTTGTTVADQQPVASDVSTAAPAITTTSDLTAAETALDQTDTSSSSDLSTLNSQLSF